MCAMVMALLLLLFLVVSLASAAQQPWQYCDRSSTYTASSTYQANLRLLSTTFPKKTASNSTLFATGTAGDVPDTVYALALCRGDTNASDCEVCVATAFEDGQQLCAYNKGATVYYDRCMLSFSNHNFLSQRVNDNLLLLMNTQNFTISADSARLLLFTLMNNTAQAAADSSGRFTTSRLDVGSRFPTLFCLMQCTPDLTADECAACFQDFPQMTLNYLDGKQGGRILGRRCSMRYEEYPFFQGDPTLRIMNLVSTVPGTNDDTPGTPVITVFPQPQAKPQTPAGAGAPPPEAQTTVQEQHGRNSSKPKLWVIGIAVPLLSILLCFVFSIIWIRRRRKGKANLQNQAAANRVGEDALVWRLEEKSSDFTLFDFSEILDATRNFSEENRLGQGGFGPVYKGQLPGGMEVAVKRLASHSGQGFTEFKNEVELIAKLQHNNLVRLLGCCIQGEEKILVYEYLLNKSLDFFIFDGNRATLVDWNKRRSIIEGIAQGLLYLHKHSRLRIIHRDLKASNILLDQDMNPKISDFGLAKIFSSNDSQGSTKRVVGTYGYMSPEYASEGIYSIKSDVFSFGVLLLEILSGKRNSGFHQYGEFLNLLGYSWQLWIAGSWLELVEADIAEEIHTTEARRYINIALMCVQESADDRPTMSDVVAMLNSESVVLPEPNHPAYFNLRVSKVEESATVADPCSINGVTISGEVDGR